MLDVMWQEGGQATRTHACLNKHCVSTMLVQISSISKTITRLETSEKGSIQRFIWSLGSSVITFRWSNALLNVGKPDKHPGYTITSYQGHRYKSLQSKSTCSDFNTVISLQKKKTAGRRSRVLLKLCFSLFLCIGSSLIFQLHLYKCIQEEPLRALSV